MKNAESEEENEKQYKLALEAIHMMQAFTLITVIYFQKRVA